MASTSLGLEKAIHKPIRGLDGRFMEKIKPTKPHAKPVVNHQQAVV
jgi:hypothetical protein